MYMNDMQKSNWKKMFVLSQILETLKSPDGRVIFLRIGRQQRVSLSLIRGKQYRNDDYAISIMINE